MKTYLVSGIYTARIQINTNRKLTNHISIEIEAASEGEAISETIEKLLFEVLDHGESMISENITGLTAVVIETVPAPTSREAAHAPVDPFETFGNNPEDYWVITPDLSAERSLCEICGTNPGVTNLNTGNGEPGLWVCLNCEIEEEKERVSALRQMSEHYQIKETQ